MPGSAMSCVPQGTTEPPISAAELAGDLLARGTEVRMRVTGSSMTPFIRSGDVVTLVPPPPEGVSLGDVVACSPHPGRLVIHRVVAGTANAPWTQGDAVGVPDEPGALLGVVSRVERAGQVVRLGLGPGRRWLALAQRRGLLRPLRALAGAAARGLAAWRAGQSR